MEKNFDKAFSLIIGAEGGYVNDPRDPGGETKYGISKKAYPNLDIKNLSLDDAKVIYKRDYWDMIGADDLQAELDIAAFDCAVNQGVSVARALLIGTQDLNAFMRKRLKRYIETIQKNKALEIYMKGWFNRVLNTWDKIDPL